MPAKRKSGSVRTRNFPTRVSPRPTGDVPPRARTPLVDAPVQPQYSPEPPPNQLQQNRRASEGNEPSARKRPRVDEEDEEDEEDLQGAVDAGMGRLQRSASPERKRSRK